MRILLLFYSIIFISACTLLAQDSPYIAPTGNTIESRISTPPSYERIPVIAPSFANYLRQLPLHPNGKQVYLYDGSLKGNQSAHVAVVDVDMGNHHLQECADAVMRLRAEYFYQQKQYDQIHFNFTNGFRADFSKWKNGYGISVKGNEVRWVSKASNDASYASFRKYLKMVFAYAGTHSLERELKTKEVKNMKIGDVFIQGGFPGHVVLVADMAVNGETGEKIFLLIQSFMPAQEIHVLKNPNNRHLNPWYSVSEIGDIFITPEWEFTKNHFRGFNF